MNEQGMAPRWGGWLSRTLARGLLRLFGWKVGMRFPNEPKLVLTGAPHTSNWDGVFAVSAILSMNVRINWFAKDSLFRWPFKSLLVGLGGVPIRRDKARGVVEQTADIFAEKERIYIVVAPEGTRARAPEWKSGFYRIAMAANVPILLAYMDYQRKVIGTGPLIRPSGNYEADLETIQAFYRGITARHPERFLADG